MIANLASRLVAARRDLRRRRLQREFPIAEPALPPEVIAVLRDVLRSANGRPELDAPGQKAPDEKALARLVTSLWRARQRQNSSHLNAAWDHLTEAGVEVQDHHGTAFDTGLSINVLAFQPRAGATGETIVETVKPTIYLHGRRIQMGEVIVERPEEE